MNIGDRIKARREELKMSQEELANKVGYKSRSSINKIEIDGRGLPQKKIVKFAKALETTPAHLMGWDEEYDFKDTPKKSISSFESLSDFKNAYDKSVLRGETIINGIVENAKKLNNDRKKSLLDYSNFLLSSQEEELESELNAAHARTDIDIPKGVDTTDNDIMDDENF